MRNLRKKFRRPKKSWNIESIAELNAIKREYGLKNTRELLIARARVGRFRGAARKLIATSNENEKKILIGKLAKMGLLKPDAGLDDVLALGAKNILDRRLQTLVFRRGMSSSIRHARQLIVHGRVSVNGVRTKFPSYIVLAEEEPHIGWSKGEPKKPEGRKKSARKHGMGQAEEARQADADNAESGQTDSISKEAEVAQ